LRKSSEQCASGTWRMQKSTKIQRDSEFCAHGRVSANVKIEDLKKR
jgi:hypothetical protein